MHAEYEYVTSYNSFAIALLALWTATFATEVLPHDSSTGALPTRSANLQ